MSAAEIVVVARWQPRDGAFDEVLAVATAMRTRSLAEPGCLGYDVYLGTDLPRSLLLVERYRDDAALAAHRASDHYRTFVTERALPLLAAHRASDHYRTFVTERALPLLAAREVRLLGERAPR